MNEETDQNKSDHDELIKQRIRRHDDIPFHGHERGQFYRIHPLLNYPLHTGTPPAELGSVQIVMTN